jgi:outer membrane protein assembly factor BamB
MKSSNRLLLLAVLLALFAASACAPTRLGTSWASMAPLVVNEQQRVLVTFNNWALLLDPTTGKVASLLDSNGQIRSDENGNPRRWEIDGHGDVQAQFFSRPLPREEAGAQALLLPTHSLKLLRVDVATARVDSTAGIPVEGPIVADVVEDETRYYLAFDNRNVVALDKETLQQVWKFETKAGIWATPVLRNGVLYFATIDHFVYALNAEDGTEVWAAPANTGGLIGGSVLVTDDYIYVGNTLERLYRISTQTGEIVSDIRLRGWVWSAPVLVDNTLYIADLAGWVYALDAQTLEITWEVKVGEMGIRPSPLVIGDKLVVASRDGRVHWLNRSTGLKELEREIEGRPEILSDLLYLPQDDSVGITEPLLLVATMNNSHLVVAFGAETGTQKWVYAR